MASERPRHKPRPPSPLPVGTRLGAYEVRKVLGAGSYGFVYRVTDHGLDVEAHPDAERDLAVREFLPVAQARRDLGTDVLLRTPADAEAFAEGLRLFVDESAVLANITHPSLVRIQGSWQENHTAYRAMTLVHGRTLVDTVRARGRPPGEPSLRALLASLLDALEALHQAGIEHRDVAPQNVVLEPNERPVLLDLDSPRRASTAAGVTGTAGTRDGYAPIELYGTPAEQAIGPWTDLYALGATLHFLICGKAPPPAQARVDGDQLGLKLARSDRRHSLAFLAVVDWMLAPQPADRPQNVQELRAVLAGQQAVPERHRPPAQARFRDRVLRNRRLLKVLLAVAVLAVAGLAAWAALRAGWVRLPGR